MGPIPQQMSSQGTTSKFTNVVALAVCESMMQVESECEEKGECIVCIVI